jgi:tRNA U54 and U55 pseudouridine synthase Pus10
VHDRPNAVELVAAVRDFLERVAQPELRGHSAFSARVAANALAIVERELVLGASQDTAERERLRALLGKDGPLAAQNRDLCREIRAGRITRDTPGLLDHLRATTLAKLAVDQPGYSGYRRALERDPAQEAAYSPVPSSGPKI